MFEIEVALAEAIEAARKPHDPRGGRKLFTLGELKALTPRLAWVDLFRAAGLPMAERVVLRYPAYFERLDELLRSLALDEWKGYLRWRLAHARIDQLPERFRVAGHEFYGKTLGGDRLS